MSDYSQYLDFTREIALESGKALNNYFGNIKTINKKNENSRCTSSALQERKEENTEKDANNKKITQKRSEKGWRWATQSQINRIHKHNEC